jgi:hypothetical protein
MRRVIESLLSDKDRGSIRHSLADHGRPTSAEVLAEISRDKNRLLAPEGYERASAHPGAAVIAAVWRESEAELTRSSSPTCSPAPPDYWLSIRTGWRGCAGDGGGC